MDELRRKLLLPGIVMFVAIGVGLALRVPYFLAVLAFAFAAFALVTHLQEFATGTRARMRGHGEPPHRALARLIMGNRRRYGGYIAHLGVISLAVGIAASSTYVQEYQLTLRPNAPVHAGGYDLRLDRIWAEREPSRFSVGADVYVYRDNRFVTVLEPRLNYYASQQEPIPTPSVREANIDLYLNLMAFEQDGSSATFTFFIEPLVMYIWIGGVIIGIGAIIALWPDRSRRGQRAPGTAPSQPARKKKREAAVAAGAD